MLGIQSLAFFHNKLLFFRKNLKIDNFLFSIKHKTTQNKELKYRRKNIVCFRLKRCPQGVLEAQKEKSKNFNFTTFLCACPAQDSLLNPICPSIFIKSIF